MTLIRHRRFHTCTAHKIRHFSTASVFLCFVRYLFRPSESLVDSYLNIPDDDDLIAVTLPQINWTFTEITIGTVIRGDELQYAFSDRAHRTYFSLYNLAKHFGPSQVVVLVDADYYCDSLPAVLEGIRCTGIQHCINDEYAAPTMDCIFETLLSEAMTEFVGYVNGDILIFQSLVKSLAYSAAHVENLVMVGRRRTIRTTLNMPVDLDDLDILEDQSRSLSPDGGYAIDYFFTRKALAMKIFHKFPAFVVGTYRWDNVLLSLFYKSGLCITIDATQAAPVLHMSSNKVQAHLTRPAASYNQAIAVFCCGDDYLAGSIDYADLILKQTARETFPEGFSLLAPNIRIKVLRCSLKNGVLAAPSSLPNPVERWLKEIKRGVPRGIGVERIVHESIRHELEEMPRFRYLKQIPGELFVFYEPTLMNFVFSLGQAVGSRCLAAVSSSQQLALSLELP